MCSLHEHTRITCISRCLTVYLLNFSILFRLRLDFEGLHQLSKTNIYDMMCGTVKEIFSLYEFIFID
jgi:hypothetical protein